MLRKFLNKIAPGLKPRAGLAIKLQLLMAAMLAAILLNFFYEFYVFLAIEAVLALYFLFTVAREMREKVKQDYWKHALFFLVILAVIQLAWLLPETVKDSVGGYSLVFGLVIGLVVFVAIFKLLLGRNYAIGEVLLSNNEIAVVETDFDLLSFTNSGRHVVESGGSRKQGESVKLAVKNLFFTRKPYKIIQ